MRILSFIFAILLGSGGIAHAQQTTDRQKWDVSGSAALFEVRPDEAGTRYGDDWYFNGRYAITIGHYWAEHLKTEVEYATSGEGSIYREQLTRPRGDAASFPYSVESFHRLEQVSARMVYQFRENAWIHPYVSGGVVGDRDRQRTHVPAQYRYMSGRLNEPIVFVPALSSEPAWKYRIGFAAAAGAKIYLSRRAFFNTGVIGTFSKPAATVSILAGFGIDF